MEKKEGDPTYADLIKKKERCGDLLLHTTNTFNSSSSSSSKKKFGSFILLNDTVDEDDKCSSSRRKPSIVLIGGGGGSNDNKDDDDDDKMKMVVNYPSLGFPLAKNWYTHCVFSEGILIGSCNGLACLYVSRLNQLFLWNPNPSINEVKMLPKSDEMGRCRLVSFGFDLKTKDFKVMVLISVLGRDYLRPSVHPVDCRCRVQIYSLSTNSWRLLDDIFSLPGDPFFSSSPGREPREVVYLNGSCFFLAHFFHSKQRRCLHQNHMLIISFDFTKEMFTPIQLPDHHLPQRLYLTSMGDKKLVLFTVCPNPPPRGKRTNHPDFYKIAPSTRASAKYEYEPPLGKYCYEVCISEKYNIWMLELEEEQVSSSVDKKSWEILHSFETKHKTPGEWSSPSCISDDGYFALLETRCSYYSTEFDLGKKMKLYNLLTKEVMQDFLSGSRVKSKAYAYKPSPVSLVEKGKQQQQQPIG